MNRVYDLEKVDNLIFFCPLDKTVGGVEFQMMRKVMGARCITVGRQSLCAMCFDVKKNSDRHSTKTGCVGGAL